MFPKPPLEIPRKFELQSARTYERILNPIKLEWSC